jgi:hypothetical protein
MNNGNTVIKVFKYGKSRWMLEVGSLTQAMNGDTQATNDVYLFVSEDEVNTCFRDKFNEIMFGVDAFRLCG